MRAFGRCATKRAVHPIRRLQLGVVICASALAAWAVTFPPTSGTTVEPNEWFGRQVRTTVSRTSGYAASESINGVQLFAELAFIGIAAGLVLCKARGLSGAAQAARAFSLASHTASAAMFCLPFGHGTARDQIGMMLFLQVIWFSPMLWANMAAVYVAQRASKPDRPPADGTVRWLLWVAALAWAADLVRAWLLGDSWSWRWQLIREVNSGAVAAFIAVLFSALAGTFHRAATTSAPPASGSTD